MPKQPSKKPKDIDALISQMSEKFTPEGALKPVVSRGEDLPRTRFIPCSSPALSYIIGGGWPEGKLVELFGKEGSAKTTMALLALKDLYEFYDGKRGLVFVDIEHKLDEEWAKRLGVPIDEMIVVLPPNSEAATDMTADLIRSKKIGAIAFDSIGAAGSKWEHETFEDREHTVGKGASIMSRMVKTVAPLANLFSCTCIMTNQLRADMSGYNRPMTPGGLTVKHMMSQRIYLRPGREKYTIKGPDGKEREVGMSIMLKIVKNTFGPRNREGWSDFYWEPSYWYQGIGFNVEADIQRLGVMVGLVEHSGPWYSYRDVKEKGRDNFFAALRDQGLYDQLEKEVEDQVALSSGDMDYKKEGIVPKGIDIDDEEV